MRFFIQCKKHLPHRLSVSKCKNLPEMHESRWLSVRGAYRETSSYFLLSRRVSIATISAILDLSCSR
ncbi:Uncharacterised protein [Vibrio cholerae]|nr:Uncharacterised protein [Vibrio cholerae]